MLKPIYIGPETGAGQNFGLNHLMKDDCPDMEKIAHFDWAADMAECPQDPLWHAEGDVWTHTAMVLAELRQLPDFELLSQKDKFILQWAAVLHDVAKPLCTETDENGRIVSPKHAKLGEKLSRQLLWDLPFELRESICAIVRLHGLPIWAIDKVKSKRHLILASQRIDAKLLYLFAKADMLGRSGDNISEKFDRIELFKALCMEADCWENAYAFYNSHSKFRFFIKDEEWPGQLFDNTEFEIIALSGIPGSGKDHYANALDLPIISLDAIRKELKVRFDDARAQGLVAQTAYERAKKFAAKKQSFVWNSTNLTSDMRMKLLQSLSVYNPRFRWVYLEAPLNSIQNARKDIIKGKNLTAMFRILEMPMPYEGHEVLYIRR